MKKTERASGSLSSDAGRAGTRLSTALLPLLLSLGLAACGGGGGGGGGTPTPTPVPGGSDVVDGGQTGGGSASTGTGAVPSAPSYGGSTQPPISTTTPPAPKPAPTPPGSNTIVGSQVSGAWDPRILPWSDGRKAILPIHAALLPDGRVMSYGTHGANPEGRFEFNFDVWTPPRANENDIDDPWRHMVLPTGIDTYLFCSALILMPTSGELLLQGGDNWDTTSGGNTNTGTSATNIFSPATNQMRRAGQMHEPRWYGSVLTLPDGRTYVQGGTDGRAVYGGNPIRATRAEIRDPATGVSTQLSGFDTTDLDNNYPRNFVGPDGLVFGFDHQQMYRIDPSGKGSRTNLGTEDWEYGWSATSTAVMFEPGRILVVGGSGTGWKDDGRTARIIDLNNGPTPQLTSTMRTSQLRQWSNSTVLPDGKVVLMGGSEKNVIADQVNFPTGQVAYRVEIFDPANNSWTLGPSQQRMRLYHSIALLLPNGTVLSASGGWPGPQLNLDAEIYYPPYLFKADGSLASRLTIDSTSTVLDPGQTLTIQTPDADKVARVTIVKTGAVTHSFNFEQRFIEVGHKDKATKPIVRQGNQLQVKLPANRFETPPGYYMAFVLDANGVPSEGKIFRINPTN